MKLVLGTVQFGLEYGINNKTGKPSRDDVFRMLDLAAAKGIESLDTAAAYGDAEEIIGEYLKSRKGVVDFKIISKLMPNLITEKDEDTESIVEREIKGSLKRLNKECLDGYLLHTPANFYNKGIIDGLIKCKRNGLIKNLGVSIYETQEALDAASSGIIDYIQIPYNVFDQRLNKTDFFEIARKNNVTVFSRSTFLQGLILMDFENIPEHLEIVKGYLGEFDQIISKFNVNRLEASFLFSHKNPNIGYLVFGVDSAEQLLEDIDISQRNVDFDECYDELYNRFLDIEKSIVIPSLWAKNKIG
jgi:aryl-alcohol dehydrogenase-like predicted oxidoreductase